MMKNENENEMSVKCTMENQRGKCIEKQTTLHIYDEKILN